MTNQASGDGETRGKGARYLGWLLAAFAAVLLVGLMTGWTQSAYRFLVGEETLVLLTVDGLVCGEQIVMTDQIFLANPGGRVAFHNNTGFWTVPVQVAAGDSPDDEVFVTSPPIPPSGTWSYVLWRPGMYYMTVVTEYPVLQGLSSWIYVTD